MREVKFMGKTWAWNDIDEKLIQVNDWIQDLHEALKFVPGNRRGTAIQAGGAMGMWPRVMSDYFDSVYTFEPDAGNYACLEINCSDRLNIQHERAAVGLLDGFVRVELPPSEANNSGAYYTMPALDGAPDSEKIRQYALDSFMQDHANERVDFIQLDVEGREMCVLGGAFDLIIEHAPVIMLEDKPLPQDQHTGHKFGEVERWLTSEMGYRVAKRIHRDIIFVPGSSK